jgi:cation diffusion facilitator CzcD-associated flavoprotein CzcO
MAATWDAIVIGGGHNGLVAGAYLARAGARTVVLEARHKTGGAAATDAPWPEAPDIKVTRAVLRDEPDAAESSTIR